MIKEFLEIGKITGTHGIKGEMRVQPWCDSPEFMSKFRTLYLDKKGEKKAAVYYKQDHTHTSKKGAELNAKMLAKGLKKLGIDLTK